MNTSDNSVFEARIRIGVLLLLTTVLSGVSYWFLRTQVAYAIPLRKLDSCGGVEMGVLGKHLDACSFVDNNQFLMMIGAALLFGLVATAMLALIRNVRLWPLILQWNAKDGNNGPAIFFFTMGVYGLIMVAGSGVSTTAIMLFRLALGTSAFFLVGTLSAFILNILLRGDVKSAEEWVARFESDRTEGPTYITLAGYLIGLAWALAVVI